MGLISKSTIDKVFEVSDLEEIISDFVELKKMGSSYSGLSPVTDEKTPSFKVSPSKGVWKCFSSGVGGKNAIDFLMKVKEMNYREAIEYIANKYAIPVEFEDGSKQELKINEPIIHRPKKIIEYSYHNKDLVIEYGNGFKDNNLIQFLKGHFPIKTIQDTILYYRLGTSKHIKGATLFWYLNQKNTPQYGKIIQYDRNTGSSKNITGQPIRMSSMSYELGIEDFIKRPTLFGQHLINNNSNYYGIVESEKTAFIMTMIDDRMTWIASGGASKLSLELLAPFGGKNIILFPDAAGKNNEAFERWNELSNKAKTLGYNISCSTMLNDLYGDLNNSYDLADHYLNKEFKTVKKIKPIKEEHVISHTPILSPEEQKYNKLLKRNNALEVLVNEFGLVLPDGNRPRKLQ